MIPVAFWAKSNEASLHVGLSQGFGKIQRSSEFLTEF